LRRCCGCTSREQCLGLSDEGIEDALYDSHAVRRFVGMDLAREAAPDATTLLRFRRLLEAHHLTQAIFEAINRHLANRGAVDAQGHGGGCHDHLGTLLDEKPRACA
jgi:IS5 family transposase